MNKLIKEKIKESRKESGDKTMPLKEALQAVFSRPNEDFMIEKILSPLRTELDEYGAWEKSINALVKEAVGALKNPTAFKSEALVTYSIFLENLISELKPKADDPFEKSVLVSIQNAEIELTKEAQSERRLRMMKELTSPSTLARLALEANAQKPKHADADAAASSGVGNIKADRMVDKKGQTVAEPKVSEPSSK